MAEHIADCVALEEDGMDVHTWFGLTYANYLVLPRTLMQSMPAHWQRHMVNALRALEDAYRHIDQAPSYSVRARDPLTGKFIKDPVPHYNRGRTYVAPVLNDGSECGR